MVASTPTVQRVPSSSIKQAPVSTGLLARGRTLLSRIERFLSAKTDFSIRANAFEALEQRQLLSARGVLSDPFVVDTGSNAAVSDIAMFDDGSSVVVWEENNGSNTDLFARMYDVSGAPLTSVISVGSTIGNQSNASVVASDAGFIVVWDSPYGAGGYGDSSDIYVQRYDTAGKAVGSEFMANDTQTLGSQRNADIAMNDDGSFVIVWEDNNAGDGSGSGIFMQSYDSTGKGAGLVQVNTVTTSNQFTPSIAMADDGSFAVAFTTATAGTTYAAIVARIFPVGGSADPEFLVNTSDDADAANPSIAMAGDGTFAVAWGVTSTMDASVYTQLFEADGTPRAGTSETLVYSYPIGIEIPSSIAMADSGAFAVAWTQTAMGNTYTQFFYADGTKNGANELVLTDASTSSIAMSPNGSYIVAADELSNAIVARVNNNEPNQAPVYTGSTEFTATPGVPITFTFADLFTDDLTPIENLTFFDLGYTADSYDGGPLLSQYDSVDGVSLTVTSTNNVNGKLTLHFAASDDEFGTTLVDVVINVRSTEGLIMVGDEEVVNTTDDVSQGLYASSVPLPGGGYVVTWSRTNADTTRSIMARIYDDTGTPTGDELTLVTDTPMFSLLNPKTTALADGGFAVTWSGPSDGDGDGVFTQTFDNDGAPVSAIINVNTVTLGYQNNPRIAGLVDGGFVVTWESYDFAEFDYGIFAQIFNSTGAPVGSEFLVNTSFSEGYQANAAIAPLTTGGFVIAWENYGDDVNIFTQIYDKDGKTSVAPINATSSFGEYQAFPSLVGTSNGGYALAYSGTGTGTDSSSGIYLVTFDATNALIQIQQVNEYENGLQVRTSLTTLNYGRVLVTWNGESEFDDLGINARLYDSTLTPLDSQFRANTYTSGAQAHSTAVPIGDKGGFAIVWRGPTSDASPSPNIAQQRYTTAYGPVVIGDTSPRTIPSDQTYYLDLRTIFTNDIFPFDDMDFNATITGGGVDAGGNFLIDFSSITDGILELQLADQLNGDVTISLDATDPDSGYANATILFRVRATEGIILGQAPTVVSSADAWATSSAKLADGRAVVIWSIKDDGIYAHFIGKDGQAVGADFLLAANHDGFLDPGVSVTGTADGGFVAAWQTDAPGFADVIVQRFDATGAPVGSPISLNPNGDTEGGVFSPTIQALTGGGFAVAWTQSSVAASNDILFAQVFTDTGTPVSSRITVLDTGNWTGNRATIAALNNGTFVIAWNGWTNSQEGILAQLYSSSGVAIGSNFYVSNGDFSTFGTPQAVPLTTGGFAIVWDANDYSENQIFARIYDADGEATTEAFAVNRDISSSLTTPRVATLADGHFLVTWLTASGDLKGQVVNSLSYRIQDEFFINNVGYSSPAFHPTIAGLDSGEFFVTWRTSGLHGQSYSYVPVPNDGPVASPIPTVILFEDGTEGGLDLANYFSDDHDDSSDLTFQIMGYTHGEQIWAGISGTELWVEPQEGREGVASITIRAIDSFGAYTDAQVYVSVSASPDRSIYPLGPAVIGNQTQDNPLFPDVATAADGSYVLVWEASGLPTGEFQIVGRRFGADGLPIGNEFSINTLSGLSQNPSVAMSWDGSFVVAWSVVVGSDFDIVARRFDSTGTALGAEFVVNSDTTGNQTAAAVSAANDGRFVVVWESTDVSSNTTAKGQKFAADGTKVGTELALSDGVIESQQFDVAVAMNPDDGSFIAVWSGDTAEDMGDIYARFFDSDGKAGSDFLVNTTTEGCQCDPQASMNAQGMFTIVWTGDYTDGEQIFGQSYDDPSTPFGGEFIPSLEGSSYNDYADVGVAADGSFIVSWLDMGDDANTYTVFARHYNDCGCADDPIVVSQDPDLVYLFNTRVGVAPDGRFVVAWYNQGDQTNVNAQSYVLDYELVADPFPNLKLPAGTDDFEIDLFYAFEYGGDYDLLTFSVVDNTNPGLFDTDIDSDGYLLLTLTPDTVGSGSITIRATTPSGLYQDNVLNVEVAKLEATITLNDTDTGYSGNLYDSKFFGDFEVLFLGISGVKGGAILADYAFDLDPTSYDFGDFTIDITGTPGKAAITLSGIMDCGCPIQATLYVNVLDTTPPEFEGFKAIPSVTSVAVGSIDVFFSEAIDTSSFNWESVTLTRDGGANLIDASTGAGLTLTLVNAASNRYRIGGLAALTSHIGDYVLTLVDGAVKDPGGNPMGQGGDIDWRMRAAVPSAPTLSPSSEGVPGSGYTPSATPTLIGTGTPGSTIEIYENAILVGTGTVANDGTYSVVLDTLTDGNHTLKARALDGFGSPTGYSANYTIHVFSAAPEITSITTFSVSQTEPVKQIQVRLNIPAAPGSFTWEKLLLTRDGGGNLATSAITVVQSGSDPLLYTITIPYTLTAEAGNYQLTVDGPSIQAMTLVPYNTKCTTWTMLPAIIGMSGYTVPLTSPLAYMAIRFGTQINPSTFDWNDVVLTRDGGSNIATSAITITQSSTDPLVYLINLPASLVSAKGAYVLKVNGAGIQTPAGAPFTNNGQGTWSMNAAIIGMSSYPSTQLSVPLAFLSVRFGTQINTGTFDWTDLELTRNGGSNIANSSITITQSATDPLIYNVNFPASLVSEPGNYVLKVFGAAIQTTAGANFVNNAQGVWTMLPAIISIPSYPTTQFTSPVTTLPVRFGTAINPSTFDWTDLTFTRDGNNIASAAITITATADPLVYNINLPSSLVSQAGAYYLKVTAAGIQTPGGVNLVHDVQSVWTMRPSIIGMSGYTTPLVSPLAYMAVRFGTQINTSTFDFNDLEITRNGGPNLASAAVTITQSGSDPLVYLINLPASMVSEAGSYVVKVLGAGIQTQTGAQPFANNAQGTWTMSTAIIGMSGYQPAPVNYPAVRFGTQINTGTFDWTDLELTRNGGSNLANNTITITQSGTDPLIYFINLPAGLVATPGNYTLKVLGAGIQSIYSVNFVNNTQAQWTIS